MPKGYRIVRVDIADPERYKACIAAKAASARATPSSSSRAARRRCSAGARPNTRKR